MERKTVYVDKSRTIEVELNGQFSRVHITRHTPGKQFPVLALNFDEPVAPNADAEKTLRSMGEDPANWLMIPSRAGNVGLPRVAVETLLPFRAAYIAEREAAKEAQRIALEERRASAIAACPTDCIVSVVCDWQNGDLMAGQYEVEGLKVISTDTLDSHQCGVWYVPRADYDRVVAKAAENAKLAEAEGDRRLSRQERIKGAFEQAAVSGERVEIGRYTDECDDDEAECSLDLIVTYAMPDGTKREERTHTY